MTHGFILVICLNTLVFLQDFGHVTSIAIIMIIITLERPSWGGGQMDPIGFSDLKFETFKQLK